MSRQTRHPRHANLIGVRLIQDLVQTVVVSHRIAGRDRTGLLLLAEPESGKTTIACSAKASHVAPIAMISGVSILEKMKDKRLEFLLFNDLAAIRALSHNAQSLLIVILNQVVQGELGEVHLAGRMKYQVDRILGIIGCMPFNVFTDRRAHWKQLGFISRMIPFAYRYDDQIVATIKDTVETLPASMTNTHGPRTPRTKIDIVVPPNIVRSIRVCSDARANKLDQRGIRLLKHYHVLIRAHALLHGRTTVNDDDLAFLYAVDSYVSVTQCQPLGPTNKTSLYVPRERARKARG